jgi:hypothetical protein
MAREDIDMWLVLTDPNEARHYIEFFDWRQPFPPDFVEIDSGRCIYLKNICDEDAVVLAAFLLRAFQVPREMAEKNIAQWEH